MIYIAIAARRARGGTRGGARGGGLLKTLRLQLLRRQSSTCKLIQKPLLQCGLSDLRSTAPRRVRSDRRCAPLVTQCDAFDANRNCLCGRFCPPSTLAVYGGGRKPIASSARKPARLNRLIELWTKATMLYRTPSKGVE